MKRHLFLVIALLAARPLFGADPQPLTLAQALTMFRAHSPALAAARAHYQAVQADEVTAALRPNPDLNLANEDFDLLHLTEFHIANLQEFSGGLTWTFERGGKRPARINSARWSSIVAGHKLRDTQRTLELQLKTAFVNVVVTKAALKLAEENLADYQRTMQANQLRLEAGDISQTDFDRIKLQEASFQSDLLNGQTNLAQSRSQLAALIGVPLTPGFDVAGSIEPPVLHLELDQLQQEALKNRPDYLAAVATANKAEADHRLAMANGATDLLVTPEYKRNGPDNTVGVIFNFPLRIFDRNQGEKLRTSRETVSSQFAEQQAKLQTIADVTQAYDAWRAADARARLYMQDYLTRARDVRQRIEFSYEHGATNLLDFLDAVRSYRSTQLDGLNAEAQVWLAIHQLSAATATEVAP